MSGIGKDIIMTISDLSDGVIYDLWQGEEIGKLTVKEELINECSNNEGIVGSWRSFWTSDASVESQNEKICFH